LKAFFTNKVSRPQQYFIAVLFVCLVAGVCFIFSNYIGYKVVAFVLFITVSTIAMFFDILPVLLAALLSALIWDYFFIPPRFTFHIGDTEDMIMLLMYFVIASVNAALTFKIRQVEKIAREEEEKANTVKLYNLLLNSLSHELRTPIATIIGASDNLLTDKNKISEDNKKHLIEEISKASLRLNHQVENLLNMSRLESGFIQPKKDWCDVNELIYSVINQLDEELKHHKIKVELKEGLPLFKLDYGLMQQVLYNLISNAAIYTPQASEIVIKADIYKEVSKRNSVLERLVEMLILTVEDNGKGFPNKEIHKVFDKFYRVDSSKTGGTGLGLSIVKGLVEAHKGKIKLNNREEGGSRFIIEIPTEANYSNNLNENE
jgi:two-component system sensor histidine kinase KdpD